MVVSQILLVKKIELENPSPVLQVSSRNKANLSKSSSEMLSRTFFFKKGKVYHVKSLLVDVPTQPQEETEGLNLSGGDLQKALSSALWAPAASLLHAVHGAAFS